MIQTTRGIVLILLLYLLTATSSLLASNLPLADGTIEGVLSADPTGGTGGGLVNGSVSVTVIDAESQAAIEGAFVMIGNAFNDPFSGNTDFTDATGFVQFSNASLLGPYDITVGASGHQFFTMLGLESSEIVVPLRVFRYERPPRVQISGNVTNATLPPFSNKVYAALGLEQLNVFKLMFFDIVELIAPLQTVDLSALLGVTMEVIGNTIIPPGQIYQPVNYKIPVLNPPQNTTITAIGGSIPTAQLIAETQNATDFISFFIALTKIFTYKQTGIRNIYANSDLTGQNINLSQNLSETMQVNVKNHITPFKTLAVPLMHDTNSYRFLPTSIKYVCHPAMDSGCSNSNGTVSVTVATASNTQAYAGLNYGIAVISSWMNIPKAAVSTILKRNVSRYGNYTLNDFLKLPSPMSYNDGTFTYSSSKNTEIVPQSPDPSFYRSVIYYDTRQEDPDTGNLLIVYSPTWEIYCPSHIQSFTLPTLPTSYQAGGPVPVGLNPYSHYLWEVQSAALTNGATFDYHHYSFNSFMSRVTHSSRDIRAFSL